MKMKMKLKSLSFSCFVHEKADLNTSITVASYTVKKLWGYIGEISYIFKAIKGLYR